MQIGTIAFFVIADYIMNGYFFEAGDIAEGYGSADKREGAETSGAAKGTVYVIGR